MGRKGALAAGVALLFAGGMWLASNVSARDRELLDRALTAERAAASYRVERDLESARGDSLELVSSSETLEHTADSLRWNAVTESSRVEAALAARVGAETSAELRELADSAELVLLDSLESSYGEEIAAVRTELRVSREETASLYDQRTTLLERVASLERSYVLEQQVNANLEDAVAAYRELARPGLLARLSAELVDPSLYVGVAIGAGLAIASR